MNLPEWRDGSSGLNGIGLGLRVTSPIEEREERSRSAINDRFKDTPLHNIERKLRMNYPKEIQTPTRDFRQTPFVSDPDSSLASSINKLHGRSSKNESQQLSTIISQREIINRKDTEILQCLAEIKGSTNILTSISEVINEIESHITSEGGIDTKILLKLLQPLKNSTNKLENNSSQSSRDTQPRELLLMISSIQKLSSDVQSLLQVFTQCLTDSSKAYKEELAHARERLNLGTRNALQAEKAAYHSSILLLKEQHAKELRDLAEQNMKAVLDSESRIRSLNIEFDELRANSQLVHDLKKEVQNVEEKIQQAIQRTRDEERHRHEHNIQEVREQCQILLKEAEETIQKRQRNFDDYSQEKLDLQKQHHDQMIQFLQLERDKLEKQNADLMKELHQQRENFALEKEKLLQDAAAQRQRVEHEVDELRAEHLQTVTALKAEFSTKSRQLKVEEKHRLDEALVQLRREREQLEANHAAEIDRIIQQNKTSTARAKAQLEVKHEDELKSIKRKHDNEINRFSSEIDRMRRLIARKGLRIELDDDHDSPMEKTQSRSGRHGVSSPAVTPQPHTRTSLTEKKSVNFQTPVSPQAESQRSQQGQYRDPVMRISDSDRTFSFTPTKSLDWTMLKNSIDQEDEEILRSSASTKRKDGKTATKPAPTSPKQSPTPSSTSLSYSPSPKGIGKYLKENTRPDQSLEIPPPPPPDSFPLDVAWETSKIPGHNVSSNATKVESYMTKLQRYLEGEQNSGISDSYLSHDVVVGDDDDEDITFPSRYDPPLSSQSPRLTSRRVNHSYASEPDQDSLEME